MNDTSSSPSPSSSIIIVIIVIASAIIVSASIYLLLRFLSRRCRLTFRTFSPASAADDVVLQNNRRRVSFSGCLDDRRVADSGVFDSLPIFTFGSVTGKLTGGDCAVCLSKFESRDQLRLLPLCCHAFHARCIDTWLSSNLTCPLCRSTVIASDYDVLNRILSSEDDTRRRSDNSNGTDVTRSGSFRVEIGSVSRRRGVSETVDNRRSYSIGSFEYIVDGDGYEVPVDSTHHRGVSDCTSVDKDFVSIPVTGPPGENLAADDAGGRSWLRDYVDRLSSFTFSSRTVSFRSSGRFFTGSSRRSDVVVPVDDLEANRIGEEISELFRWLSGV
ncbi:hypothetical protein ACH5RR_000479 [Cinchona calisaya]|uniref:RING-type E3 ubiquitin transferase n=1 Tax=Cinchona calisaya TaxID=153742 RepID=A0ABD3B0V7_9GENT